MARIYAQGHDLTLSIAQGTGGAAVQYEDICSSATLTYNADRQLIEALSGQKAVTTQKTGTLDVELYQYWVSTSSGTTSNSICKALWNLANTAPDTAIAAILKVTGATGTANVYTFNIYPEFPPVGGVATDALTSTVSFTVVPGSVVLTTS